MPDKVITITVPSAKVAVALQGFLATYPNIETIPDPAWVDPGDGTSAPNIPKYTNSQWVSEMMRRLLVRDVRRGLQKLAHEAATVAADDSLATVT